MSRTLRMAVWMTLLTIAILWLVFMVFNPLQWGMNHL